MNTQTGEIIEVPKGRPVPRGHVLLTKEEIPALRNINNRARLRRYKQMHADDDCRTCEKKLRRHTLKQFQACYAD